MRTAVDTSKPGIPDLKPVPLERARPEFRWTSAAEIAEAMAAEAQGDIGDEISRLVGLYKPVLAPRASALRPAGMLRLDVRCPIERVAASLAFHALRGGADSAAKH